MLASAVGAEADSDELNEHGEGKKSNEYLPEGVEAAVLA